MSKVGKMRLFYLLLVATTTFFMGMQASAQVTSTSGSGTASFGSFSWQVDRAPITTTLNAVAGFNTPPPNNFFQVLPTPASAFTVHEVHGTFSITEWTSFTGTCGNGSDIVQVLDQNGNAIASVKLQVLGPGTANIPIEGTFSTPLSVSGLVIQYNDDQCGSVTLALSLVMS